MLMQFFKCQISLQNLIFQSKPIFAGKFPQCYLSSGRNPNNTLNEIKRIMSKYVF
eukprot:m.300668 g.300668  ORF g.300668 m.300668 type:complete len:55 (+) comp40800_c1_seq41:348-512(+)